MVSGVELLAFSCFGWVVAELFVVGRSEMGGRGVLGRCRGDEVAELPSGTVTFLFTDLEGSTRLWEQFGEAMQEPLACHDAILRNAVELHAGYVVKTTGDGIHAVFALAPDAVAAAVDAQRALGAEEWGEVGSLRVRMGLHSGTATLRSGDYFGPALNRAARLMAIGHGGQILCSQVTVDLARDGLSGELDLVDLGSSELRDLGRPEQLFQVVHPSLERNFPPLRSLDAIPSNLPSQRTEFVGRAEELAKLTKLLDRSRVVTLTGVGGVGKTRLALQSAASLMPRFDDGVWFVDLAPLDDTSLVAAAVASAMRLPDRRQGPAEEAIVAAARDARALIILDNCEHVIAAVASLVELITDSCQRIVVVSTSREPLGVEGERVLGVGPLGVPDTGDAGTLEEILASDAVRLFVERAGAAREGFELNDDNAGAVATLCRRLDGIPLALELAAARVPSLSPQSILERLNERFRLLSHGRRTALARHQTLRAAVDWSYDLLEGAEQVTFARLSVFAGGCTLEAAEAVVADDDADALAVLDTMGGLVAKSMVLLDEGPATVRYRLLDTMREYAADRLEGLEPPAGVRSRHADYYVQFAEQAAPHIVGTDDIAWTERLEEERDNLHVALTWVRDHDAAKLTRMALALGHFWWHQRHYRDARTWISAALKLDLQMSPAVRSELAALGGQMALHLSHIDQGNELLQESLEASAEAGNEPIAETLIGLAVAALVTNRPADTRRCAEQAVAASHAAHDPYRKTHCLAIASVMFSMTGDNDRGRELGDEAIELARSHGNEFVLGVALEAGGMARYQTDPEAAIVLLDESILLSRGPSSAMADQALFFKGVAHARLHDYGAAAQALDEALVHHHAAGAEYYASMALAMIAGLLARLGFPATAVRILGALARLRDEGRIIGAPRDLAMQEQLADQLRQGLGTEEFAELRAHGRHLTLDGAVSLARAELLQVAGSNR